jgi:hypothetical protein
MHKLTIRVDEATYSGLLLSSALLGRSLSKLVRDELADNFKVTTDNVCQVVRIGAPVLCTRCHQLISSETELALYEGPETVVHIRCGRPVSKVTS